MIKEFNLKNKNEKEIQQTCNCIIEPFVYGYHDACQCMDCACYTRDSGLPHMVAPSWPVWRCVYGCGHFPYYLQSAGIDALFGSTEIKVKIIMMRGFGESLFHFYSLN